MNEWQYTTPSQCAKRDIFIYRAQFNFVNVDVVLSPTIFSSIYHSENPFKTVEINNRVGLMRGNVG